MVSYEVWVPTEDLSGGVTTKDHINLVTTPLQSNDGKKKMKELGYDLNDEIYPSEVNDTCDDDNISKGQVPSIG